MKTDLVPPSCCGCPEKKKQDEKQSNNQMSEEFKKAFRLYMKCPCDSEKESNYVGRISLDENQVKIPIQSLKFVSRITKTEMKSCMWNHLYNNPLVSAIFEFQHKHQQNPNLFDEHLPNVLYDGYLLYQSKLTSVKNYFFEEEQKRKETERKMRQQNLKPNRRN